MTTSRCDDVLDQTDHEQRGAERKPPWLRQRLRSLVTLAGLGASFMLVGASASPAPAAAQTLLPLVTFYSPGRGDFFTTSQPAWTCKVLGTCGADPNYHAMGMQGHVFNPAHARPAGTVPLYHWWSVSRGDNFLTTDPRWAGVVGDFRDGYRLFRIEGYIRSSAISGNTVELASYWNPTTADNAAVNPLRSAPPAGWTRYRTEGHLLGPTGQTARNWCVGSDPNNWDDAPWQAHGNRTNPWNSPLVNGDTIKIRATGSTRIDYWGTNKPVQGEGIAGAGWPAPDAPRYALIGFVSWGRIWVPGRGWYERNVRFPVGAETMCLEYSKPTGTGELLLQNNDTNLGDNGGGPMVTVRQWW
jgi:hypothetical protein